MRKKGKMCNQHDDNRRKYRGKRPCIQLYRGYYRTRRRAGFMKTWILVLFLLIMASLSSNALAGRQEDLFAKGKALYNQNCSRCHGINGVGTDKGPPFLNKIYRPSHHSNLSFQMAVLNGVRPHHWNFGFMPKIEGVSMSEAGMIIRYIRAIQQENGIY